MMQLRCGGISGNDFITNFSPNVPVKNFDNRSIFGEDMDKSVRLIFWTHPVSILHICIFTDNELMKI